MKSSAVMAWAAGLALVGAAVPMLSAREPELVGAKQGEAQASKLKVGDQAPALAVKDWIKGEPITGFEKGKVYVVEFWATWCGPCIKSMPHLSHLQREYKDRGVTVVGVTKFDRRNTIEKVRAMVAEKGDGMGYTVATDEGATYKAFMTAAGEGGIPTSFVVDQGGKVAFIGHPMFLDYPLQQVVAGTWSAEEGLKEVANAEKLLEGLFAEGEPTTARFEEVHGALNAKFPSAAEMLEEPLYMGYLTEGQAEKAAALGQKLFEKARDAKDAMSLNQLAWALVDPMGAVAKSGKGDLELAWKAAQQADVLSEHKDAAILDTLARVMFLRKDLEGAITTQAKAVALAEEGEMRDQLSATLGEYKKAAGKN